MREANVRLQRIDELTRREHYFLREDDACYYFGEYTARTGIAHGIPSALVHDLLERRDPSMPKQDHRKDRAMSRVAQWMNEVFDQGRFARATFVPLPQSGAGVPSDADDRIFRILRRSAEGLDVRKMLELTPPPAAREIATMRSGPDVLYENMRVMLPLTEPKPIAIFLVDDVLVTGANFVAGKRRIQQLMPDVPIYGLFIARKALDSGEILAGQLVQ
jgi:hypothetical protein